MLTPPKSKPLTQAEVDTLPDETPIIVVWSGGNGPHRYMLGRGSYARSYAICDGGLTVHYLDRCGKHPLTQVWLDVQTPVVGIAAVGKRV